MAKTTKVYFLYATGANTFLPLALLRLMTERPFLVAIRLKNPWTLKRFTFPG